LSFGIEENVGNYLNLNIDENNNETIKNKNNELKNKIFSSEEFFLNNNITKNDVLNYVKYVFGYGNINRQQFTNKLKMIMKIFFISYISNGIIDKIIDLIEHKKSQFIYKSIFEFYYKVLTTFNKAINGCNEIRNEIVQEKKNSEEYNDLKSQKIGEKPNTEFLTKKKD